jgi:hypothetical protein
MMKPIITAAILILISGAHAGKIPQRQLRAPVVAQETGADKTEATVMRPEGE